MKKFSVYLFLTVLFSLSAMFSQTKLAHATPLEPCPYVAQAGRTIVDFAPYIQIVSDIVNYPAYSFQLAPAVLSLPAGNYKVSLFSSDSGIDREHLVPEPNERWYLSLLNGATTVAITGTISDLQDGVNLVGLSEEVNASLTLGSSVTSAVAVQANYPDTTSPNSVFPICAAFDLLSAPAPAPATLHVIKLVVNASGGVAVPADFSVNVKTGGVDVSGSPAVGLATPGTSYSLAAGAYSVSETANPLYTQTWSGDCDATGNITLAPSDEKICTLVNTDIALPPPVISAPVISPSSSSSSGGGSVSSGGSVLFIQGAPGFPNTGGAPQVINITKVPDRLTPFEFGGGYVTYTYTVTNPGAVPMSNVSVVDDKCAPVTLIGGDINLNNLLEPTESWIYTCRVNVQTSNRNIAVVSGTANGIVNLGYAFATVLVNTPGFPNTGFAPLSANNTWEGLAIFTVLIFLAVALKKHRTE